METTMKLWAWTTSSDTTEQLINITRRPHAHTLFTHGCLHTGQIGSHRVEVSNSNVLMKIPNFFCGPRYRTSGNYSSTISGRKERFRQRKQYAGRFPKMSLLMTHSFITFYCFHCRFKSAQFLSNGGPDFVSQYHCDSDPGDFRMFSTRLPLFRQKRPMTFPDEIASNMSNKCTFITPNSLWTSHMKNELQCE